eukprot:TRINITY_DN1463_c0_g1_i1.p1 TRINITY_DN1463_c0_g1~~TRINITY_DN1463_c0_g1_i1.p1  ORF type:complete len:138 (+),score=30.27 TRINITY_DN1463_c0_g1_i1:137-550(+)
MCIRDSTKAVEILQAVYSPDELVSDLNRVWAKYGTELEAQAAQFVSRESDRVAREMEKNDQDSEYQLALAQDQAREHADKVPLLTLNLATDSNQNTHQVGAGCTGNDRSTLRVCWGVCAPHHPPTPALDGCGAGACA